MTQLIAETVRDWLLAYKNQSDNVGLMAVARVLINLAQCLTTHFGSRNLIAGSAELQATQQALDAIYATLVGFEVSHSVYLQTTLLKASIWLVDPPTADTQSVYVDLVRRTREMRLPVEVADEVLQQLAGRALKTPTLAYFAMEVMWAWFLQNPLKVSVNALLSTWKGCFALRDMVNCSAVVDVETGKAWHVVGVPVPGLLDAERGVPHASRAAEVRRVLVPRRVLRVLRDGGRAAGVPPDHPVHSAASAEGGGAGRLGSASRGDSLAGENRAGERGPDPNLRL